MTQKIKFFGWPMGGLERQFPMRVPLFFRHHELVEIPGDPENLEIVDYVYRLHEYRTEKGREFRYVYDEPASD